MFISRFSNKIVWILLVARARVGDLTLARAYNQQTCFDFFYTFVMTHFHETSHYYRTRVLQLHQVSSKKD